MATNWISHIRLPEFHADYMCYPHETWQGYLDQISVAYRGAGAVGSKEPTDDMKLAHLLAGLKGKAAHYINLIPEIKYLEYKEVLEKLKDYFQRQEKRTQEDLTSLRQKPGESVIEFLGRVKSAVSAITVLDPDEEFTLVDKKIQKGRKPENAEALTKAQMTVRKESYQDFNDGLMKRFFIRGIKDQYKMAMRAQAPRTLKEAIQIAEEQEKYDDLLGNLSSMTERP